MTDSKNKYSNPNAVDRVTSLPLFSTTLQLVASAYIDVKSFHPLMTSVFSIAEKGVKTMTQVATEQATPLLVQLEPQITAVNMYACDGLSQLEEKYPVLNQTADEVAGHLKSAFYITMDNLQEQLNSKIDSALVQTNTALETTKTTVVSRVNTLLGSRFGKALVLGLDSVLTLSEELVDYYLPATEEELKHLSLMSSSTFVVTEEDEDEGPSLQDRVQSLIVRVRLRMFHQGVLIWKELKQLGLLLRYYTGQMGSSQLFNALHALAFWILRMYTALINKVQPQQQLALLQLSNLIQALASLRPLHSVLSLAGEAQAFLALVVSDLYNLSMILLQLLINTTPLYDLLKPSTMMLMMNTLSEKSSSESESTSQDRVHANIFQGLVNFSQITKSEDHSSSDNLSTWKQTTMLLAEDLKQKHFLLPKITNLMQNKSETTQEATDDQEENVKSGSDETIQMSCDQELTSSQTNIFEISQKMQIPLCSESRLDTKVDLTPNRGIEMNFLLQDVSKPEKGAETKINSTHGSEVVLQDSHKEKRNLLTKPSTEALYSYPFPSIKDTRFEITTDSWSGVEYLTVVESTVVDSHLEASTTNEPTIELQPVIKNEMIAKDNFLQQSEVHFKQEATLLSTVNEKMIEGSIIQYHASGNESSVTVKQDELESAVKLKSATEPEVFSNTIITLQDLSQCFMEHVTPAEDSVELVSMVVSEMTYDLHAGDFASQALQCESMKALMEEESKTHLELEINSESELSLECKTAIEIVSTSESESSLDYETAAESEIIDECVWEHKPYLPQHTMLDLSIHHATDPDSGPVYDSNLKYETAQHHQFQSFVESESIIQYNPALVCNKAFGHKLEPALGPEAFIEHGAPSDLPIPLLEDNTSNEYSENVKTYANMEIPPKKESAAESQKAVKYQGSSDQMHEVESETFLYELDINRETVIRVVSEIKLESQIEEPNESSSPSAFESTVSQVGDFLSVSDSASESNLIVKYDFPNECDSNMEHIISDGFPTFSESHFIVEYDKSMEIEPASGLQSCVECEALVNSEPVLDSQFIMESVMSSSHEPTQLIPETSIKYEIASESQFVQSEDICTESDHNPESQLFLESETVSEPTTFFESLSDDFIVESNSPVKPEAALQSQMFQEEDKTHINKDKALLCHTVVECHTSPESELHSTLECETLFKSDTAVGSETVLEHYTSESQTTPEYECLLENECSSTSESLSFLECDVHSNNKIALQSEFAVEFENLVRSKDASQYQSSLQIEDPTNPKKALVSELVLDCDTNPKAEITPECHPTLKREISIKPELTFSSQSFPDYNMTVGEMTPESQNILEGETTSNSTGLYNYKFTEIASELFLETSIHPNESESPTLLESKIFTKHETALECDSSHETADESELQLTFPCETATQPESTLRSPFVLDCNTTELETEIIIESTATAESQDFLKCELTIMQKLASQSEDINESEHPVKPESVSQSQFPLENKTISKKETTVLSNFSLECDTSQEHAVVPEYQSILECETPVNLKTAFDSQFIPDSNTEEPENILESQSQLEIETITESIGTSESEAFLKCEVIFDNKHASEFEMFVESENLLKQELQEFVESKETIQSITSSECQALLKYEVPFDNTHSSQSKLSLESEKSVQFETESKSHTILETKPPLKAEIAVVSHLDPECDTSLEVPADPQYESILVHDTPHNFETALESQFVPDSNAIESKTTPENRHQLEIETNAESTGTIKSEAFLNYEATFDSKCTSEFEFFLETENLYKPEDSSHSQFVLQSKAITKEEIVSVSHLDTECSTSYEAEITLGFQSTLECQAQITSETPVDSKSTMDCNTTESETNVECQKCLESEIMVESTITSDSQDVLKCEAPINNKLSSQSEYSVESEKSDQLEAASKSHTNLETKPPLKAEIAVVCNLDLEYDTSLEVPADPQYKSILVHDTPPNFETALESQFFPDSNAIESKTTPETQHQLGIEPNTESIGASKSEAFLNYEATFDSKCTSEFEDFLETENLFKPEDSSQSQSVLQSNAITKEETVSVSHLDTECSTSYEAEITLGFQSTLECQAQITSETPVDSKSTMDCNTTESETTVECQKWLESENTVEFTISSDSQAVLKCEASINNKLSSQSEYSVESDKSDQFEVASKSQTILENKSSIKAETALVSHLDPECDTSLDAVIPPEYQSILACENLVNLETTFDSWLVPHSNAIESEAMQESQSPLEIESITESTGTFETETFMKYGVTINNKIASKSEVFMDSENQAKLEGLSQSQSQLENKTIIKEETCLVFRLNPEWVTSPESEIPPDLQSTLECQMTLITLETPADSNSVLDIHTTESESTAELQQLLGNENIVESTTTSEVPINNIVSSQSELSVEFEMSDQFETTSKSQIILESKPPVKAETALASPLDLEYDTSLEPAVASEYRSILECETPVNQTVFDSQFVSDCHAIEVEPIPEYQHQSEVETITESTGTSEYEAFLTCEISTDNKLASESEAFVQSEILVKPEDSSQSLLENKNITKEKAGLVSHLDPESDPRPKAEITSEFKSTLDYETLLKPEISLDSESVLDCNLTEYDTRYKCLLESDTITETTNTSQIKSFLKFELYSSHKITPKLQFPLKMENCVASEMDSESQYLLENKILTENETTVDSLFVPIDDTSTASEVNSDSQFLLESETPTDCISLSKTEPHEESDVHVLNKPASQAEGILKSEILVKTEATSQSQSLLESNTTIKPECNLLSQVTLECDTTEPDVIPESEHLLETDTTSESTTSYVSQVFLKCGLPINNRSISQSEVIMESKNLVKSEAETQTPSLLDSKTYIRPETVFVTPLDPEPDKSLDTEIFSECQCSIEHNSSDKSETTDNCESVLKCSTTISESPPKSHCLMESKSVSESIISSECQDIVTYETPNNDEPASKFKIVVESENLVKAEAPLQPQSRFLLESKNLEYGNRSESEVTETIPEPRLLLKSEDFVKYISNLESQSFLKCKDNLVNKASSSSLLTMEALNPLKPGDASESHSILESKPLIKPETTILSSFILECDTSPKAEVNPVFQSTLECQIPMKMKIASGAQALQASSTMRSETSQTLLKNESTAESTTTSELEDH